MSSTIDERVVAMRFQDGDFKSKVKSTLESLGLLKKGLDLKEAAKGLDEVDKSAKKFSLAALGSAAEGVSAKFVAMATVAITALANITNRAIDAGARLVKSLTLDPVMDGFNEYELKMGSIQTILANTSSKGTGLDEVVASLDELNKYADKTIYNFGDMTRNIGLFTNAGIGIQDATSMIKGFSNEAAASGTNAQGAAGAAYQLSQALSAGKITLMDWRSLQNVGMGNANMKKGILEIAEAMGTLNGKNVTAKDIQTDFNGSLEKGWLTADVMSTYLKIMAGDMDAAAQKSLGLTDAQVEGFAKQQQIAEEAATKVRTLTQLMGTLKESVGSSWAETFDIVLGDFDSATNLFTAASDTLGAMLGKAGDARNQLLQGWADLGGRDLAIEAIKNAFSALMGVIQPVKDAFQEIFPPATAQQLYDITAAIRDFTAKLQVSAETSETIKRIFKGVFAAFDIGIMVIKGIAGVVGDFIGALTEGSGGVLDFAARVGDWVVNLRNAIKEGQGFNDFFERLSGIITKPIELIRNFSSAIREAFTGSDLIRGTEAGLLRLRERLEPLGVLGDIIAATWGKLREVFQKTWDFFEPLAQGMSEFFGNLGTSIADAISNMDFDKTLDAVNTGLFAALVLAVRKFLSGGINIDAGGGLVESLKGMFGGLTDTLSAMQAQLKAGTLMKIAGAIGILTASVVALSLIDSGALTKSLAAITVMFAQLAAAMAILDKAVAGGSFLKLPAISLALIGLSVAIGILALSVAGLSNLDWEELARGLSAVAVMLGLLAGAAKLLTMAGPGLPSAALGMTLVAVAVKILASAVADFAGMDWASMAQGLTGVAATLTALALFTKLAETGKGAIAQGAGLILLATALKIMASAVGDFASFSWEELGKGMAAMAVSLGLVTAAMNLLPANMLIQSVALIAVAAALKIIASAVGDMGGMSWEEIGKGLVTLAGSLAIIAGAMYLMVGALPGAAALLVVAAALAIFTPVLQTLGGMSWSEIGTGLGALAASFAVLGIAAALLTPVIPSLLGLGAAVALIGVGLAAAGIGVLAFATGLTALSVAGAAGAAAITALVGAVIGLIPAALIALAEGIVGFLAVIAQAGPQFVAAATTLILSLLTAINTVAPQIISTMVNLILNLVNAVAAAVPQIADAALRLITSLLNTIAKRLPSVIQAGVNLIVAFITGIGNAAIQIVNAAAQTVIKFVNGLADAIDRYSGQMRAAGLNLARAIIDGMTGGLASGVANVVNKARELGNKALSGIKGALGINSPSKEFFKVGGWSTEGLANGLVRTGGQVTRAAEKVGNNALSTLKKSMAGASTVLATDMDTSPTIRPVLDLSAVRKDAAAIDGIIKPKSSISPVGSYDKAAAIATASRQAQAQQAEDLYGSFPTAPTYSITQINQSPKALSAAEIYRQTNNLISAATSNTKG